MAVERHVSFDLLHHLMDGPLRTETDRTASNLQRSALSRCPILSPDRRSTKGAQRRRWALLLSGLTSFSATELIGPQRPSRQPSG